MYIPGVNEKLPLRSAKAIAGKRKTMMATALV
jgi:hypothetical protein